MFNSEFDIQKIKDFIKSTSKESKIYFGCDSTRFKKIDKITKEKQWWARYARCVIIHYDGSKGCKIFGDISVERDFDGKNSKPILRMMNEVYKVSALYAELEDILEDRSVEIHLDINTDPKHGSNCAYKEALGYIRGMHGFDPQFKPTKAFAASYAADMILRK